MRSFRAPSTFLVRSGRGLTPEAAFQAKCAPERRFLSARRAHTERRAAGSASRAARTARGTCARTLQGRSWPKELVQ
eukprot:4420275-Alexandrium_andersonii.AAC.1